MPMRKEIDGSKYDIRVICTGANDSPDAGYVEGVPIDPPDDNPGWMLVDLWVEHDSEQETLKADKEKGDRGRVVTRLVNAAYYQLWARPKPPKKKQRRVKKAIATQPEAEVPQTAPVAEPKKKRGRQKKTPATAAPPNGEAPGVDCEETEADLAKCCEHTRQMLVDTVNFGERRAITLADVRRKSPLCHSCQREAEERAENTA